MPNIHVAFGPKSFCKAHEYKALLLGLLCKLPQSVLPRPAERLAGVPWFLTDMLHAHL